MVITTSVARIALHELAATGIVGIVGQGRAVSYQLDVAHPLAPAIEQLFRAESDRRSRVFDGLRDAALTVRSAALGVWVYGSVARGEDTVTSDLDVALCVADPPVLESQTAVLREAATEIGEAERVAISVISFTADDAARLAREDAPIWRGIVNDGFTLAGRMPGAVAALQSAGP